MPTISKLARFPIFSLTTSRPLRSKPISSSSSSPPPLLTSPVPTHEHISHLILEQKSASKALETFRWASKLSNFTHSQSTYRALIHKLCNFRRFDTVNQLLDEMPHSIGSPPNEDIFITIVRGLGRARMIRQVIGVLDLISNFEKTPSLKILNSILDVLVKEDIDIAREFYRQKMMASGVEGDDYTFGILMKGLCLTNRIGDGFKLLQMMKTRGITPNTVIYNTLIHALCKNGKVGRARSLMSEMKEPNDATFNVIISAYCREGRLIQALVLLERCFGLGFVPDIITVTKVLEILCNDGRVKEAVEILERVESKGGAVDALAYNTIIKGFCKHGKAKIGLQFLNVMESKGCLPNVDTYNVLIYGFCECGMMDSALDLFNDMKTDGINWNVVTFDTLVRGLCSRGRMEDGFRILELMEESKRGSGGSISPYNSVLYGLYKNNQAADAFEFLNKMKNLFPRAVDRNLRILEFCEGGDIENAKGVYDQMTREGGAPCIFVYDRLIRGFCQEGYVREAIEILNEMVGCHYVPVASIFNAIISEFCKQGKVGSALKIMEDMVRRGCVLDTGSYRPFVVAFCSNGDYHNSLRLFQQMLEKGILPDHYMWDSLLLCMISQETAWWEGKNIFHVDNLLQMITRS